MFTEIYFSIRYKREFKQNQSLRQNSSAWHLQPSVPWAGLTFVPFTGAGTRAPCVVYSYRRVPLCLPHSIPSLAQPSLLSCASKSYYLWAMLKTAKPEKFLKLDHMFQIQNKLLFGPRYVFKYFFFLLLHFTFPLLRFLCLLTPLLFIFLPDLIFPSQSFPKLL